MANLPVASPGGRDGRIEHRQRAGVPAGKRIALMIFSSDREFTLRPDPGTKLTLDPDGTSLVLPVVGGAPAGRWETAVASHTAAP